MEFHIDISSTSSTLQQCDRSINYCITIILGSRAIIAFVENIRPALWAPEKQQSATHPARLSAGPKMYAPVRAHMLRIVSTGSPSTKRGRQHVLQQDENSKSYRKLSSSPTILELRHSYQWLSSFVYYHYSKTQFEEDFIKEVL